MKATLKYSLLAAFCLMLWPVQAAAQPPDPQGPLVYEDDFSDRRKSNLEDKLDASDYSRGFHPPGVYHLIIFKKDAAYWSLLPNLSLGNFTLEVETWDESDSFTGDMAHGVIFRAQDDTHFYAVLIDPRKKEYTARKLDGENKWSDLIPWTTSTLIEQEARVNHLRVDAGSDTFTIFLNGDRIDSFSDSSYTKGTFGFIASNVDAVRPHSHFDNLKIFSTEAKPVLRQPAVSQPAALPNTGGASGVLPLVLGGFLLVLLGVSLWLRGVSTE
jgi:hypothetical protein